MSPASPVPAPVPLPVPDGRSGNGRGKLRAVVCTSTLELGVDWGAIDLVMDNLKRQVQKLKDKIILEPRRKPQE